MANENDPLNPRKRIIPRGMFLRGKVFWCWIKSPDGERKRISLETSDLGEAKAHKAKLLELSDARSNKADLLQRIYEGSLSVRALYHAEVTNTTKTLREASRDPDLNEYIEGWQAWLEKRLRANEQTRRDYLRQVRTLIPSGRPFRRSRLTRSTVDAWLIALPVGSSSTQRRYYAALALFVRYLEGQGIHFETRPLGAKEDKPKNAPPRDGSMTFKNVKKVLAAMTYDEGRAFFAMAFGAGMEKTALERARTNDTIDARNRVIRAHGTKGTKGTTRMSAASRNRHVQVAKWAWPYYQQQLRGKPSGAPLFNVDYKKALYDFYAAQIAVGLVEPLPNGMTPLEASKAKGTSLKGLFHTLHDARHTWTVLRMTGTDGEPAETDLWVLARQLGHADLQMVTKIYSRHVTQIRVANQSRGANGKGARLKAS